MLMELSASVAVLTLSMRICGICANVAKHLERYTPMIHVKHTSSLCDRGQVISLLGHVPVDLVI